MQSPESDTQSRATGRSVQDSAWESVRKCVGDGRLSIIMPVYNLESRIRDNLVRVRNIFLDRISVEIIPVDDGSSDATRREIEKISDAFREIRPVYLDKNAGKGAALRAGFEASSGNYVLLLDADLDLPPQQVVGFFEIMRKEQADVVIGSKRHPDSVLNYPWQRRIISAVYYFIVKMLIGLPIHDTQTGIKLFRREALAYAFHRMLVKRFAFDLEILAIAHGKGYRVAEAPVTLDFQPGSVLGCVRPSVVQQVMTDTLAIFYRIKILRYYQRIRDTQCPPSPPLVSIVMAFDSPTGVLEEAISEIACQTYTNYEVILLPDQATGRKWASKFREIPTGPLRPAEKRNMGIESARGSIVAFLGDGAYPAKDWLERAVPYFTEPWIGAVGGPATTAPGDPVLAQLSGRAYANMVVSGSYRYRYKADRVREVKEFPSFNLLVRADLLKDIGGFNTGFRRGEDTILCLEITRRDRTILYDPRVQVHHHLPPLFLPHLRQLGRYARQRGHFARKFPATSRRVAFIIPSLLVLGLVGGAALALFRPALRVPYGGVVLLYLALTALSAFHIRPRTWLLTWLGVISTHLVYGIRFLQGLLSHQMPDEAAP